MSGVRKWWGVRHVRYAALYIRFAWWWTRFGSHFFITPNPADFAYLNAVWEGKA